MQRLLISLLFLLLVGGQTQAQDIISGYEAKYDEVYDDSLAAAVTKVIKPATGHRGWYRVDPYHYFSSWVEFDTTGFSVGIGLTSADTVKIWMEQFSDASIPSTSSDGFYEYQAPGTAPTRTLIAKFDSTNIVDNPKVYRSFHGSGDPEIAPSAWVRFYSEVVGGFTSGGLGLKFGFIRQP